MPPSGVPVHCSLVISTVWSIAVKRKSLAIAAGGFATAKPRPLACARFAAPSIIRRHVASRKRSHDRSSTSRRGSRRSALAMASANSTALARSSSPYTTSRSVSPSSSGATRNTLGSRCTACLSAIPDPRISLALTTVLLATRAVSGTRAGAPCSRARNRSWAAASPPLPLHWLEHGRNERALTLGHRADRLSLANLHAFQELRAAALPPAPLARQQRLNRHAVELPAARYDDVRSAHLACSNPLLELRACLAHQVRLSERLVALLEASADITRIQGNRPPLREQQQPSLPSHAQSATSGTEKFRSDSRRASRTSGPQPVLSARRESGSRQTTPRSPGSQCS